MFLVGHSLDIPYYNCDERDSEWLVTVFEGYFGTQRNTDDGVKRKCIRWRASTNGALYIPRYVDTGNNRITP